MSYTIKLNNFSLTTSEEVSKARVTKLASAVISARSIVRIARMQSFETLALTTRPDFDERDLPEIVYLHLTKLFKCAGNIPRILRMAATAVQVVDDGLNSGSLEFTEYGTSTLYNAMHAVGSLFGSGLYSPGDKAITPMFSASKMQVYSGPQVFKECLNTGKGSGNPSEIMIKLSGLDGPLPELIDTVIHEATHKFVSTTDEGMLGAAFGWMADGGLYNYVHENPNMPLPCETAAFKAMTSEQTLMSAYVLTAYILYFPAVDVTARYELQKKSRLGALGSESALGQHLRANLKPVT